MSIDVSPVTRLRAWGARNILWIMFCSGGILLSVGKVPLFEGMLLLPIRDALSKAGEMILVGGLFSAIVKSNLFMDVIGGELQKIILSSDLLKYARSSKLIPNFVSLAYKENLPRLAGKISSYDVNRLLPIDEKYYIASKDVDLTVCWADDSKDKIKLVQRLRLKYVAESAEYPVIHHLEYCPMMGSAFDAYGISITDMLVDNQSIKEGARRYVTEQNERKVTLTLTGKEEYEILRYTTIVVPLYEDPTFFCSSRSYVLYTEVNVKITHDDINVLFTSIGIDSDFQDRPPTESLDRGRMFSKVYADLILPEQGFMLVFGRKV